MSSNSSGELDLLEWMDSVGTELDRLGCRWVIAGAVAASRYRLVPRVTTDLDILTTWDRRIPEVFGALGYSVILVPHSANPPDLVVLSAGGHRIELILAAVEYQMTAIERGQKDHFLTPEDVIIHKLIAWRPRDRDDIASILAAGVPLDIDYIEYWASEWDVLDRWHTATRRLGRK